MENKLVVFEEKALTESARQKIVDFFALKKQVEEAEAELRQAFLSAMEETGVKTIKTDDFTISYKSGSVRETFDSKSFKAENEDLYNQYIKISETKPSVQFAMNKKKGN